jgi:riboflavin kinase/FMN adenylyltransferase
VVHGQKLGRTLGYPTANVARSAPQVIPADGVYAGVAHTRFGEFQAAIGIGKRPTVNGTNRTVEAFLLDFEWQNLYGSSVDLDFAAHLRPEAKFESLDELQSAMANDVAQTRELLAELQPSTAAQR